MFDNLTILQIVVFVIMLFVSIALHEMMHAYAAYRLGDDLAHSRGRISLNPLTHIDPFLTILLPTTMLLIGLPPILAAKPVPINPNRVSGEELGLAVVGLAGPLTNLFLAAVTAFFINILQLDPSTLRDGMLLFLQLNVGLFVFNMLPLPPLDGSRLLYAVAPAPVQRIMDQIEQFGILMIIILLTFLLPVLSPYLISANDAILQFLLR